MHTRQNAGQVRLHGLDAGASKHRLHDLVHNLLKIFAAGTAPAPA